MIEKNTEEMIPFLFQKEIKADACEDAPPIATEQYAIVCDGLGGAGFTKHKIPDGQDGFAVRTSAYMGSRIVSACVETFYQEHMEALAASGLELPAIRGFADILQKELESAIQGYVDEMGITLPRGKTIKIFPTTLACACYLPCGDKLKVAAIWAGDSRVYVLTPSKGLQLLSLDDADGAADAMNSATVMTNCIYAGSFHLNYCVYTLEEPGIVFCCSDGCFDFLRSPLNMEWLLLNAILTAPGEEEPWGEILGESIRDGIYQTIKDDTTMAGICFRFQSLAALQEAFRPRMEAFEPKAIQMNQCIKEKNTLQDDLSRAKKVYHLHESKVTDTVQEVICKAIRTHEPGGFYEKLMKLEAFSKYQKLEEKERQRLLAEFELKSQKLKNEIIQRKKQCRSLFILDYMGQDCQPRTMGWPWGKSTGRSPKYMASGEVVFNTQEFDAMVATLIALMNREEYYDFFPGIDRDIQSSLISALTQLRDKQQNGGGKNFYQLLKQAYFSTDLFSGQREELEKDPGFQSAWESLLKQEKGGPSCSAMTSKALQEREKAIALYRENMAQHQKKMQKRLQELAIQYYTEEKEQIQRQILDKSTQELQELFQDSGIDLALLIQVADAWKALGQEEKGKQIKEAESGIQQLWADYRTEYELFKQVERGRT